MKIDYIVIAGSSGGHILPSISLINQLAKLKKKSYLLLIRLVKTISD